MKQQKSGRFFGRFSALLFGAFVLLASCSSAPRPYEIADLDPVRLGAVESGFSDLLGKIQQRTVEIYFDPRKNSVYLDFRYETVKNRQHWSLESRQKYMAALSRYEDDFTGKKLDRSASTARTRRVYGKIKSTAEWGQFALNYRTDIDLSAGYIIKGTKGYFTISQPSGADIETANSDEPRSSQNITMYLSRAQAAEIAKYFDQEFLMSQIQALMPSTENSAPDVYDDDAVEPGPEDTADDYLE
jgi:hypothetical protein